MSRQQRQKEGASLQLELKLLVKLATLITVAKLCSIFTLTQWKGHCQFVCFNDFFFLWWSIFNLLFWRVKCPNSKEKKHNEKTSWRVAWKCGQIVYPIRGQYPTYTRGLLYIVVRHTPKTTTSFSQEGIPSSWLMERCKDFFYISVWILQYSLIYIVLGKPFPDIYL
jgi:hypothetical protein